MGGSWVRNGSSHLDWQLVKYLRERLANDCGRRQKSQGRRGREGQKKAASQFPYSLQRITKRMRSSPSPRELCSISLAVSGVPAHKETSGY